MHDMHRGVLCCGNKPRNHMNGMCMVRRVVTLCLGLVTMASTMWATPPAGEYTIYSVSIEPTYAQNDEAAPGVLDNPKKIRILNLGKAVNHSGLDYGPTVSADGKTLYFVSNRKGSRITREGDFSHDFWAVKKDHNLDTVFTPPYNIDTVDAGVNTVWNEGVASIAADRQTLYFTGCNRSDGLGDCDIYVAEIEGDHWATPRNLGRNVNSEYWDSQPTISPGKDRLYFTSNRPSPTNPNGEGQEDTDLWFCDWDDDLGEWKPAINLGPDVNTAKSEVSPFIAADGNTLFIASNGHKPNLGGLDFYKLVRTGEKDREGRDRWTKVEALPQPINTPEDEQFITLPASGDVLYFSSRRKDLPGFQGDLDIFMAFIPSYFRAVNVIITVIDECTGLNVPATVSYKNPKTGRVNKDSVDNNRTESNMIVANDDYGAKAVREDSLVLTITASSPAYGERSITVPVRDPGKTLEASEANSQVEIRKTITLGQRPVLGAEMAFSDWSKKKNDGFRGLVLQEKATIILYPLLPYVFFDLNSSQYPERYTIFKNAGMTSGFNDERIPGGTLQKYYHVLNIYGYRLTKHPDVKIELVGCVDELNEDKNSSLPMDRAKLVFNYLKDIWKIDESRMKLTARGYPVVKSNPKDSLGMTENRRTELLFTGSEEDVWQVSRPILDNDPTLTPDPDVMTWTMKNGIDSTIVDKRRIEIWRQGKMWKVLSDVGTSPTTANWNWMNDDEELPQERKETADVEYPISPYSAQLVVVSKNGTECRSDTVKIPVKRVSTKSMMITEGDNKTYEKYNLILFPFDRSDAGPMNERILREYVYKRVKLSSTIQVDGKTDVVGMDTHNKGLSERRAKTCYTLINSNAGKYSTLNWTGTGEELPLYTNELPEGRFFNRTVQVIIETPLADAERTD